MNFLPSLRISIYFLSLLLSLSLPVSLYLFLSLLPSLSFPPRLFLFLSFNLSLSVLFCYKYIICICICIPLFLSVSPSLRTTFLSLPHLHPPPPLYLSLPFLLRDAVIFLLLCVSVCCIVLMFLSLSFSHLLSLHFYVSPCMPLLPRYMSFYNVKKLRINSQ